MEFLGEPTYQEGLYEYIHDSLPEGWEPFFESQLETIHSISKQLKKEATVYPPVDWVFRAFNVKKPKVVILGQDPYHNGTAVGLAFSYPKGVKARHSLKNIHQELLDEGFTVSSDLSPWMKEGVMLLNTALTVRAGKANSHSKLWSKFTEDLITWISNNHKCVFILWGRNAQKYKQFIKGKVIEGIHPSPLSAKNGFFSRDGAPKYFIEANEWLVSEGITPVDWNL